jgi:hypothetical protein
VVVADVPTRVLVPGMPAADPQPGPQRQYPGDQAAGPPGQPPEPVAQSQFPADEGTQAPEHLGAMAVPLRSPTRDPQGVAGVDPQGTGRESPPGILEARGPDRADPGCQAEVLEKSCLGAGAPTGYREPDLQDVGEVAPLQRGDPTGPLQAGAAGVPENPLEGPQEAEPSSRGAPLGDPHAPVREQGPSCGEQGIGHQNPGPATSATSWVTWRSSVGALVWHLPAGVQISECILFWLG